MSHKRPPDWYNLSPEQQRFWDRSRREQEDLEYDLERTRDEHERAARQSADAAREAKRELESVRCEADEAFESLQDDIRALKEQITLHEAFLQAHGLRQTFLAFRDEKRP